MGNDNKAPDTLPADFKFEDAPQTLPADFSFDTPQKKSLSDTTTTSSAVAAPVSQMNGINLDLLNEANKNFKTPPNTPEENFQQGINPEVGKEVDKKKAEQKLSDKVQKKNTAEYGAAVNYNIVEENNQYPTMQELSSLLQSPEENKARIEELKSQPVDDSWRQAGQIETSPNNFTPVPSLKKSPYKTYGEMLDATNKAKEEFTKLHGEAKTIDFEITPEIQKQRKDAEYIPDGKDAQGNEYLKLNPIQSFVHGFSGSMDMIELGLNKANPFVTREQYQNDLKLKYLKDNILFPKQAEGKIAKGTELLGGVTPLIAATVISPEGIGAYAMNALTFGTMDLGAGNYEGFVEAKNAGKTDAEAMEFADKIGAEKGLTGLALGATMPLQGEVGKRLFLNGAEAGAFKTMLAEQGVMVPAFMSRTKLDNLYAKSQGSERGENEGVLESGVSAFILAGMTHAIGNLPRLSTETKTIYENAIAKNYEPLSAVINKAVESGIMDFATNERIALKAKAFNTIGKDLTPKLEAEVLPKQMEIDKLEAENKEKTGAFKEANEQKIEQLNREIHEDLGTPLNLKEAKRLEDLNAIAKDTEDKLTKTEIDERNHLRKRKTASENREAKLEEEKLKADGADTKGGNQEGTGTPATPAETENILPTGEGKKNELVAENIERVEVAEGLTHEEANKFIADHAVQPKIQKNDYRPNFGLSSAELEMGLRHVSEGKTGTVSAKRVLDKIAEWKREGYVDMLAGGGGTKASMSKVSIPFEVAKEASELSNEQLQKTGEISDAIDKANLDEIIGKFTDAEGNLDRTKLAQELSDSKGRLYFGDLIGLSEKQLLSLQTLLHDEKSGTTTEIPPTASSSKVLYKRKSGEEQSTDTSLEYKVNTEPVEMIDGEPGMKVSITKPNGEVVDLGKMYVEDVEKETAKKIRGFKLSDTPKEEPTEEANQPKQDLTGKTISFEHAGSEKVGTVKEVDKNGNLKVTINGTNYTVKPENATEASSTQKFYENVAGAKPNNQTGRIPVEPIVGGKPKNIRDIIFDVTKGIKQRLFFSKPSSRRGSVGTYSPGNSAVKIKFNGDLDVTAHELGHSIDDHFGILSDLVTTPNLAVETELNKFSPFGSKPPKGHPNPRLYTYGEGFAEFLRAYIVNPAATKAEAPELTKLYESKVSNEYKKAVNDFSTDIRTWAGSSARDITLSNIEVEPKKETLMGKILGSKDTNNEFTISWVDKLAANFTNPLTAFNKAFEYAKNIKGEEILSSDDPRILARLLLGVDGKYGEILQHGMIDGENKLLKDANGDVKNLDWLLKPLDNTDQSTIKRDAEDVMAYMVSERTVELSKKFGRENVLSGVGGGMFKDVDVAQKTLDEFNNGDPNRLARIQEAANRYREFSDDILKYMVEKGRMSKENYDQIKADNLQYVAMMRVMETEPNREIESSFGKGGKLGNKSEPIKKITGSTKTIQNPYISLINTLHKAVTEADRNDVLRSFRDILVDERKMYEGEPKRFSDVGVIGKQGDKNAITIFVDGKPEHWLFQEDVYKALKGLDGEAYKLPSVITAFPKLLRWTVTHFPTFAARNVVRDFQDRIIKSNDGSGFRDLFGDKEHWRELARSGGLNAGYYFRDKASYYGLLEEAMHDMAKNKKMILTDPIKLREMWEGYKSILTKSETINRVAEYRAAFKKAKTDGMGDYNASIYAGYKSRDLMDFALMGHYMKVVNQIIPFSNASIQGVRKAVTSAKENPVGFATRIAAYTIAPNIALWLLNHRDKETAEEYEAMPAYQRDLAWNIKLGSNLWLSVPKPFELSLGGAGIDRALSKYVYGNENAYEGYGGSVSKSTLPVDEANMIPIAPSVAEGIVNYDLFRDKNIVPPDEDKVDLVLRNTERASRIGKILQDGIGIDARKIDHVIKGQTSYFGNAAIKTSNIGREDGEHFGLSDFGFFKETPAYNSTPVQNFLKYAEQWRLGSSGAMKEFHRLASDYFDEKDDDKKDDKAKILRDYARHKLTTWKASNIEERKKLKAEKKKN